MALLTYSELSAWVAGLAFDATSTPTATQATNTIAEHEARFMAAVKEIGGVTPSDVTSSGSQSYLYYEGRQIVGRWAAVQLQRARYRNSEVGSEMLAEAEAMFARVQKYLRVASGGQSSAGQGYGGDFISGATYTPTTTQETDRSLFAQLVDGGEL